MVDVEKSWVPHVQATVAALKIICAATPIAIVEMDVRLDTDYVQKFVALLLYLARLPYMTDNVDQSLKSNASKIDAVLKKDTVDLAAIIAKPDARKDMEIAGVLIHRLF
ncbi:hypothetical protein RTP6_7700 [Batrachochytrium dendrobatidis]